MINVILKRNKEGRLYFFRVSGHAGYAAKGNDIVCAAVSILAVNAANSIEAFTKDEMISELDEKKGSLEVTLKTVGDKSSLLLESFLLGLNGIQDEHRDYLSVKVKKDLK